VRQDQVYTHMIDVMTEISINSNKNVQELNHYISLYYTQTLDLKVSKTNGFEKTVAWTPRTLKTELGRKTYG
jgi:hypothetical protein